MIRRLPHFDEIQRLTGFNFESKGNTEERGFKLFSKLTEVIRKNSPAGIKMPNSDYYMIPEEYAMLATVKRDGAKIYKIGREFGEQLAKADLSLSCKYLPTIKEFICIEFPDHMRFQTKSGGYLHCSYVAVMENTHIVRPNSGESMGDALKTVAIFSPIYDDNGNLRLDVLDVGTISFWNESETVQEAVEKSNRSSTIPYSMDFVGFLMKCLIYIDSGDPDLRHARSPRPPETRKVKKVRQWYKDHANESLIDLIHVGYSFKKPNVYMIDKTLVTGHFRWQPWGHKRAKVKLIWIDQHERVYRDADTPEPQVDQA